MDNLIQQVSEGPPIKKARAGASESVSIKGYPILDVWTKRMIDIKSIINNNMKSNNIDIDQYIQSIEIEVSSKYEVAPLIKLYIYCFIRRGLE